MVMADKGAVQCRQLPIYCNMFVKMPSPHYFSTAKMLRAAPRSFVLTYHNLRSNNLRLISKINPVSHPFRYVIKNSSKIAVNGVFLDHPWLHDRRPG